MARKRGGLAGIYDRNKKLIKTIAPIAAGFIPGVGPLIGAGLGAAMGGDTEGKGYFKGFNTGGAIKGGVSGYAGAKLGQAAKGGLGNMFTGGMSPVDKLTGAPKLGVMTESLGPRALMGAPKLGVMTQTTGPAQAAFSTASKSGVGLDSLGKLFGKGAGFIRENEDILGKAAGGLQATRNADLADEQVRLRIAEEARQFDEAQKLRVRQQGNYDQTAMMDKQQFDELNANRARLRAILTGGM